ncbi:hypothetical protein TSMEX_005387, partial [Taenia solium]
MLRLSSASSGTRAFTHQAGLLHRIGPSFPLESFWVQFDGAIRTISLEHTWTAFPTSGNPMEARSQDPQTPAGQVIFPIDSSANLPSLGTVVVVF